MSPRTLIDTAHACTACGDERVTDRTTRGAYASQTCTACCEDDWDEGPRRIYLGVECADGCGVRIEEGAVRVIGVDRAGQRVELHPACALTWAGAHDASDRANGDECAALAEAELLIAAERARFAAVADGSFARLAAQKAVA